MRLINVIERRLEDFFGSQVPNYAILSHTWGPEEVQLADWGMPDMANMQGFEKIEFACTQAQNDGFSYLWVDTCCIDKTSSAELSEAINSMFQWYRQASVCYAYLVDVVGGDEISFRTSRWFTRGFTLQELLAPKTVQFFDRSWKSIGEKKDLSAIISEITRIERFYLRRSYSIFSASVAQRMSWAALRKTTRIEDVAYCLLGIFEVNIPLIYGEGLRAFTRLQEEITMNINDQSLFAWTDQDQLVNGIFASHPRAFLNAGDFRPCHELQLPSPSGFTFKGVTLSLPLLKDSANEGTFIATLDCARNSSGENFAAIRLQRVGDTLYRRIDAHEILTSNQPGEVVSISVRKESDLTSPLSWIQGPHLPTIKLAIVANIAAKVSQVVIPNRWGLSLNNTASDNPPQSDLIYMPRVFNTTAALIRLSWEGASEVRIRLFRDKDGLTVEAVHVSQVDKIISPFERRNEAWWTPFPGTSLDLSQEWRGGTFTHSRRTCEVSISLQHAAGPNDASPKVPVSIGKKHFRCVDGSSVEVQWVAMSQMVNI